MDIDETLMKINEEIREKVFGEFANRKVNDDLNKSRFKSMVEEKLKALYEETGVKYDLYYEDNTLIAKPYIEKITYTVTLNRS